MVPVGRTKVTVTSRMFYSLTRMGLCYIKSGWRNKRCLVWRKASCISKFLKETHTEEESVLCCLVQKDGSRSKGRKLLKGCLRLNAIQAVLKWNGCVGQVGSHPLVFFNHWPGCWRGESISGIVQTGLPLSSLLTRELQNSVNVVVDLNAI